MWENIVSHPHLYLRCLLCCSRTWRGLSLTLWVPQLEIGLMKIPRKTSAYSLVLSVIIWFKATVQLEVNLAPLRIIECDGFAPGICDQRNYELWRPAHAIPIVCSWHQRNYELWRPAHAIPIVCSWHQRNYDLWRPAHTIPIVCSWRQRNYELWRTAHAIPIVCSCHQRNYEL